MSTSKMSEKVRSRATARGWVTSLSQKLENLCGRYDQKTFNIIEINDAIEEFDKKLHNLAEAQARVELEINMIKLENEIGDAADFRERVRQSRIKAATLISTHTTAQPKEADTSSVTGSISAAEAKLPKLILPTFTGDVLQWTAFWEHFKAVVDDGDLPVITKFTYLRSLLKGEASAAVQGLSLTADNYKTACDILLKRLGRSERIIFYHIQRLLQIKIESSPSVLVLWEFYDNLQAHVRSLEVLKISGKQYDAVLTPLIFSRLPPQTYGWSGPEMAKDMKVI